MSGSYCSNCGSQLSPGSVFCSNCGKSQSPSQSYSQPPSSYTPPPPQTTYYSNTTNYNQSTSRDKPMTTGEFILTFILLGIPIVGFVLLLVWSFSSETNTNKKNLSRAVLILTIIVGILYGLILAVMALIAFLSAGVSF